MTFLLLISFLIGVVGFFIDGIYFSSLDSNAALTAAASVIGIWALVVGFSVTAIGITFEISKLPPAWKLRLLQRNILNNLRPFVALALLSGVTPFIVILKINTANKEADVCIFTWIVISFIYQILLIISGVVAARRTYDDLTLDSAIRETLDSIKKDDINNLIELHKNTFKEDYESGERIFLWLRPEIGRELKGPGEEWHDELIWLFSSFFRETNPQLIDSGMRIITQWISKESRNNLDDYIQYRIIPVCFQVLNIDQVTFIPANFKMKIYYLARLLSSLRESGATLTAANSENGFCDLIEEHAKNVGSGVALDQSEMAVMLLLRSGRRHGDSFSILSGRLLSFAKELVKEGSFFQLDKLIMVYRDNIEYVASVKFPFVLTSAYLQNLESLKDIFRCAEEEYGDKTVLFAENDIRFWILINMRRVQDNYCDKYKPEKLNDEQKSHAAEIYDAFSKAIDELLLIRRPDGEPEAYEAVKYSRNPYK